MPLPTVTAVIPTRNRTELLRIALQSVFDQTYAAAEIIVVVDGPDPETMAMLGTITDPRLRVFNNEVSLTAAGARNLAVSKATSEWIAFLDDDDAWLPEKLERQIAFANQHHSDFVTCLSNIITPSGRYVWPEQIYDNKRPLDEYLFHRTSMFSGSSYIQTSSFLIRRTTYERAPFPMGCPHDDWHFVLCMAKQQAVTIETVPEALVNVRMEEQRPTLTRHFTWRSSLSWLNEIRPTLSRKGYSGFCLGVVGPRAADARAWSHFPVLLYKAFRYGSPNARQLIVYFGFWLLPVQLRRNLRATFRGSRNVASAPTGAT